MVSGKSLGKIINAGHVGGRATQSDNYWDRLLPIADVALLLGKRITDLKKALCDGTPINGLPMPKPQLNEQDHMFFNGRDIEKLWNAAQKGK